MADEPLRWSTRLVRRFAEMVTPAGADECWPWAGRTDDKGYGFIKVYGRTTRVHRVAWARANGDRWPPSPQIVRHTCDNPPCCNPRHLILGTVRNNVQDCIARGRRARGESLRQARLTEEDVRAIRRRSAAGESVTTLAEEYAFTRQGISAVVTRKTWAHVA